MKATNAGQQLCASQGTAKVGEGTEIRKIADKADVTVYKIKFLSVCNSNNTDENLGFHQTQTSLTF